MSRTVVCLLAVLPVLALGCGGGGDDSKPARSRAANAEQRTTAAPAATGTIATTLDGKRVLPQRLRWVATPHVGGAQVTEVRFLIDGSERWIEHEAPFVYGSDDAGTNRGFLITTWLAPGRHRFTVEAVDLDDRTYRRSVTARVLSPPSPPAALAGRWQHRVAGGRWDLIFDRIGAWHLDPEGTGLANQVDVSGDTIHVYAPIQMGPLENDHTAIKRLGHVSLGGFDCNPAGPFGTYHWKVTSDRLTLTPVREKCPDRRQIWSHTWRRVGAVDEWRAPTL